MRAGQAAAAGGVTVKALRYYEDSGLLQPARLPNGYRDYSAQDVQLAAEIRALMSLGLARRRRSRSWTAWAMGMTSPMTARSRWRPTRTRSTNWTSSSPG